MAEPMTYSGVGVNYESMDPFKVRCQKAGLETATALRRFGFREAQRSRGESCYLIETPDAYLAHVEEGLGTKNLVADACDQPGLISRYDYIAQDTVAMIVNDMITTGALPISVAMHLAVGDSDWFKNELRVMDLVEGWKRACQLARCSWGGGETPTLKEIVVPGTALLSGSAIGVIKPKHRLIRGDVQEGDRIILLNSSGIHANGLTLARQIANRRDGFWRRLGHLLSPSRVSLKALPSGYDTRIGGGQTYGEALLTPTRIYVPAVSGCLRRGLQIHYAINITGHGWRKLMRARTQQPFAYVIERLPRQLPIFDFIQRHGPVDDREAYGNLNMGAGFALIVPPDQVKGIFEVLRSFKKGQRFEAVDAGCVEASDRRKVVILPKGIEFAESTLAVR